MSMMMMQSIMPIVPSLLMICAVSTVVLVYARNSVCPKTGSAKDMCESFTKPKVGYSVALSSFAIAMMMVMFSGFSMTGMMGGGMMGGGMGGYGGYGGGYY
jgi:hypothetical protein